jgi:hypothetical protein
MRLPVALVLSLVSIAATAQVYSWKDANGKVHYSDRPPTGQEAAARKLGPGIAPPEGADAARKALAERALAAKQRDQKADESSAKAQKEQAESAEKQQNCARAKANLQAIESGQARYRYNEAGEKEGLDGPLRDAEIANARKSVDSWCK